MTSAVFVNPRRRHSSMRLASQQALEERRYLRGQLLRCRPERHAWAYIDTSAALGLMIEAVEPPTGMPTKRSERPRSSDRAGTVSSATFRHAMCSTACPNSSQDPARARPRRHCPAVVPFVVPF